MLHFTLLPLLTRLCALLTLILPAASLARQTPALRPQVEVEEQVYSFQNADNGAGPMWCSGSTCIVRGPFGVVASGLETLPQMKPLNNCRWMVFHRTPAGWASLLVDQEGRTREPCPLTTLHDGRLFLSTNPTLTEPGVYGGPARPELIQMQVQGTRLQAQREVPRWQATPAFTEHSYRSFAADGKRGDLILFQNIGYGHAEWCFRDANDKWSAAGQLKWPWGAEYDKPQPIRICYPNVMLQDRAVHFCGVSDIIEPYTKWREYKKTLTGRDWDYDFRRLFYTWCDDIMTGTFHPWVEIASRDKTGGWIRPCDLWIDDDQRVHILWTERALDERLREDFFPQVKQSMALNYAIVTNGIVQSQRSLVLAEEGGPQETVGFARFHVSKTGRLFTIYYVNGTANDGQQLSENRIMELLPDGTSGQPVNIGLKQPFVNFFTATVRAGSPRADTIDLLGLRAGQNNTISYARIRLW